MSEITYANGIDGIAIASLSEVTVKNLKIVATGATGGTFGAIHLSFCNTCTVEGSNLSARWAASVWIDCSNTCTIQKNNFHDFGGGGTTANFGDISVYCLSSSIAGAAGNKILNNTCNGGGNEFGIALEDPYFASLPNGFPTRTLVEGNTVGPHSGYGLLQYLPGTLGTVITGVISITGTAGQFSTTISNVLAFGQLVTISGTIGGSGSISGYSNPTTYAISAATNGSTTFTLTTTGGSPITTTAGTPGPC